MDKKCCERCGIGPEIYGLFDYCAKCSRDLCDACMSKGCCGYVPAISGEYTDFVEIVEPAKEIG